MLVCTRWHRIRLGRRLPFAVVRAWCMGTKFLRASKLRLSPTLKQWRMNFRQGVHCTTVSSCGISKALINTYNTIKKTMSRSCWHEGQSGKKKPSMCTIFTYLYFFCNLFRKHLLPDRSCDAGKSCWVQGSPLRCCPLRRCPRLFPQPRPRRP